MFINKSKLFNGPLTQAFSCIESMYVSYTIKIDLTLGDDEPKVLQFLLDRLRIMLIRLEKSIRDCSEGLIAYKLLKNEQQNFQEAVDYIVQLQS